MAQVIGNLVANAIQYTPTGGRISIEAGQTIDRVWIAVEDTGSGIAPEVSAHIFDPFYRGVPGQRFPQGMGLGLAIARDIARAHGGDITVQSDGGAGQPLHGRCAPGRLRFLALGRQASLQRDTPRSTL